MRRPWVSCALVTMVGALATAPPALATHERFVTIAARSCPSYGDITANRARNNIQESLRDLGPNTRYGTGAIPIFVDPVIEAQDQANCVPLENWVFTLGDAIAGKVQVPQRELLSVVSHPFSTPIVTKPETALLTTSDAKPTGSMIEGAVTIELNDAQRDLSSRRALWIQGGTPSSPMTSRDYAFGALRCSTDNLNGDNVEWIGYQTAQQQHVFCFAYYVKPPPDSATIRVRKELTGVPGGTPAQQFRFVGNISYNPDHDFTLTAPGGGTQQTDFIRAAGTTWDFTEQASTPLARLDAIDCTSRNGTSTFTTNVTTRRTEVTATSGDLVTCVYRNRYRPPASGLTLLKRSFGRLGTFDFTASGGGERAEGSATTLVDGVSVRATGPDLAQLPGGTYRVEETLPKTQRGTWKLSSIDCGGEPHEIDELGTSVTVPPSGGQTCTFTNRFTPAGSLRLVKQTLNGFGTTHFQVRYEADESIEYQQTATTTAAGDSAVATGDDLGALRLGRWTIQETTSSSVGDDGGWRVGAVICDGSPRPTAEGITIVELTVEQPDKECIFTNELVRSDKPEPKPPEPPESPSPLPPPAPVPNPSPGGLRGVLGAQASNPIAELRVTKSVSKRRIRLGSSVRYRVVVRNLGPSAARAVTVAEAIPSTSRAVKLQVSQGRCRERPPRFCVVGRLKSGQQATVTVRVRPRRTGRVRNVVAVNTATRQRTNRGKRARAVLVVLPRARPRFTG